MYKIVVFFIMVTTLIALAGCDLGTSPNQAGNGSNVVDSTFASGVQPILTNNCAFSGCHGSSGAQQGLILSKGKAYDNIVNVNSREASQYKLIDPGNPGSSFLYLKLKSNPPIGRRMPYGGPYLSGTQMTSIQKWIEAGAKDN